MYSYYWVPVSSTGKVSDGCIRNLGFIRNGRHKSKFSIKKKKKSYKLDMCNSFIRLNRNYLQCYVAKCIFGILFLL